jgi:NADPH:quinone reductase-like Zn-dependent oxidoreductase
MKAALVDNAAPEGFRVTEGYAVPNAAPGSLLIRVRASAINPVDYKLPKLPLVGRFLQGKPSGQDFAGEVVVAAGPFKVGDAVYGNSRGTTAENVVADASHVALKPASLSFLEAASLPTVALTSLQALKRNNLKAGEKLLVIGASGGCGLMGIQIGKAMGAGAVYGICSAKNEALVKEYGADKVIDYNNKEAMHAMGTTEETKFDIIYDTVTSPEDTNYEALLRAKCLKPAGRYVAINSASGMDWAGSLWKRSTGWDWQRKGYDLVSKVPSGDDLRTLNRWVEEGKLKTLIQPPVEAPAAAGAGAGSSGATTASTGAKGFPFTSEGVQAAYALLHSRRARGKIVIDIKDGAAK